MNQACSIDNDCCEELKCSNYKCVLACPNGKVVDTLDECPEVVSRVIDGDTLELQTGERVRLMGINAPESGQNCYSEAANRLRLLVEGKEVRLEKDVTDKDQYGRLLRYVFIDGTFVNLLLVREGYANAYIVSPDVKYSANMTQAEGLAKQESGCLWQKSINYSDCISISNFHYDAAGNDNYNLNDEYVVFRNNCDSPVNMTGWTVKDAITHIYYFPTFVLNPRMSVTLYTGAGVDSSTKLYWGEYSQAVWNNDGDTLYLRDPEGDLVLVYSYGN